MSLRYEGPVSNLTGVVELIPKMDTLPDEDGHWYVNHAHVATSPDEDEVGYIFEEPKKKVVRDTWGESTWVDTFLCRFDPKKFNLTSSSWDEINAR
ncbi:uncharacterized protein N7529_002630 [Penicillium soppii]|uniref:uncharacterized protein n=1 Tax=Penicillium soppii TaxID=69789 RepID=UPI002548805A|nr:uncharacterized protein N7529_002630 [Penicillium soppii]KAJ5874200.1 hypothetical protein N7529_002630 [Penicillium soppii]